MCFTPLSRSNPITKLLRPASSCGTLDAAYLVMGGDGRNLRDFYLGGA